MALARALAIEPRVLLLDEPFGALDAKVRAELRAWLRRLHDEVHVTTVLVTHDQEEAMDVADRIVVLNEGRIEQEGTPRELYERPANGFVMSFLGPVARLGEALVRPHDLRVTSEPRDGALEAMVDRVVHLGFEVRAELQLADGAPLAVQLTRDDAVALELAPGDIVWVGHTVEPRAGDVAASCLPLRLGARRNCIIEGRERRPGAVVRWRGGRPARARPWARGSELDTPLRRAVRASPARARPLAPRPRPLLSLGDAVSARGAADVSGRAPTPPPRPPTPSRCS